MKRGDVIMGTTILAIVVMVLALCANLAHSAPRQSNKPPDNKAQANKAQTDKVQDNKAPSVTSLFSAMEDNESALIVEAGHAILLPIIEGAPDCEQDRYGRTVCTRCDDSLDSDIASSDCQPTAVIVIRRHRGL